MSSTKITSPSLSKPGSTISDRAALLQAICPGNRSTSSTMIVLFSFQEVPQTPFPNAILVQATGPWNGPSTSWLSLTKYTPTQKKSMPNLSADMMLERLAIRSLSPSVSALTWGKSDSYFSFLEVPVTANDSAMNAKIAIDVQIYGCIDVQVDLV